MSQRASSRYDRLFLEADISGITALPRGYNTGKTSCLPE